MMAMIKKKREYDNELPLSRGIHGYVQRRQAVYVQANKQKKVYWIQPFPKTDTMKVVYVRKN